MKKVMKRVLLKKEPIRVEKRTSKNYSNRFIYFLVTLGIFTLLAGGVYAISSVSSGPNSGHPSSDIDFSYGITKVTTTGNNVASAADPKASDIVIGSDSGTRHDSSIMFWSSGSASRIFNSGDVFYLSVWSQNPTTGANVILPAGVGGTSIFKGSVSAPSFLYSSDKSLKTNIVPIPNALERLQQLNGVSFNWKDTGRADDGLIAQDVEKVFPELVSTDSAGLKSVEYGNLVGVLVEAIKEQQKQIDELKSKCN